MSACTISQQETRRKDKDCTGANTKMQQSLSVTARSKMYQTVQYQLKLAGPQGTLMLTRITLLGDVRVNNQCAIVVRQLDAQARVLVARLLVEAQRQFTLLPCQLLGPYTLRLILAIITYGRRKLRVKEKESIEGRREGGRSRATYIGEQTRIAYTRPTFT